MNVARGICRLGLLWIALFQLERAPGEEGIRSDVYAWKDATVEKAPGRTSRRFLQGSGTDFQLMNLEAVTLAKDKGEPVFTDTAFERLVIVKDGRLRITLNGESEVVGPGSVALILPGDEFAFKNASDSEVTFFIARFKSKGPADRIRGRRSGGSVVMDWNGVKPVARDDGKGTTRSYFARSTVMARRLEVHCTELNPGQSSHSPHHHNAEEMVMVLKGNISMYLGPGETGGRTKEAHGGDIIYLVSNEYHALSNTGRDPALYIAIQFE